MITNRTFFVFFTIFNLFLLYSNMYLFESRKSDQKVVIAPHDGGVVRMLGQRIKSSIVRKCSKNYFMHFFYFCRKNRHMVLLEHILTLAPV